MDRVDGPVRNYHRAHWAKSACEAFANHTGQSVEFELDDIIGDLIADMMHLAHQRGIDPYKQVEDGIMHYEAELLEDE